MNSMRKKVIIDERPEWDSSGTIGAPSHLRHATPWRTGSEIYAQRGRGGDIHKSSTVIKVKKIFARF
jgi:hypothetical protein